MDSGLHQNTNRRQVQTFEALRDYPASAWTFAQSFTDDPAERSTRAFVQKHVAKEMPKGTFRPGCVRIVTTFRDEDPEAYSFGARCSLLVVAPWVPSREDSARRTQYEGTAINGLVLEGNGLASAVRWLVREGFEVPMRMNGIMAGVMNDALGGESANLALALAVVSYALDRPVPVVWVPSAGLGSDLRLEPVGRIHEKDEKVREESGVMVVAGNQNEVSGNALRFDTLDDVVRACWPDFVLMDDARERRFVAASQL